MTVSMISITFDCEDPVTLSQFWSEVLGRPIDPPGIYETITIGAVDRVEPIFAFQKIAGATAASLRVHPDFGAQPYILETARIESLGATRVEDIVNGDIRYTIFADPEGNKFDIGDE